ncbi:LIC10235 family protein [Leptospira sp. GIMC2001]|uniref:LIC10235 family protein n=1 Tax=Leptospira sp. GIMC2001 TaxID=1513297 RepID=UPI00234AABD8|nr:hypothetical protein [Leptospira sp. GIMC2001]WCL48697.1 hypothetical protein O4O04_15505 [Leptospira sp. GIMC2001]
MEPIKVNPASLDKIASDLKKDPETAIGNYLYKGFRIQISKYKASGAERVQQLYKRRRENGMCIVCGTKVSRKNPATGKLYRLCDYHRSLIDQKNKEKSAKAKKAKKA